MGTHHTLDQSRVPFRGVSLAQVVKIFWSDVNTRLVGKHRVAPPLAARGVRTYRRRVGSVALNRGVTETAADIAAAVKNGGFPKIKTDSTVKKVTSR